MSSLQPRPEYTDAELARLYPEQLRLAQVHIFLRHGERTPVGTRFATAGLPPYWPYCSAVRLIRSPVLDPTTGAYSPLEWRRRLETFSSGTDDAVLAAGPNGEVDGICDRGMLTDRGRETTHALGSRLRRLYIDRLGFLPADGADTVTSSRGRTDDASPLLYLRATMIPRALDSLLHTLHGLYPTLPSPTTIIRRPLSDETLFPNDGSCRRFAELSRAFAQRAATRWNDSPEMAYMTSRIGEYMDDSPHRVAVDSHPRLSGIMDSINASAAHGPATRLPPAFYDPKLKRLIETVAVDEWFAGYRESREYRSLGIGALLGDVAQSMVQTAQHATTAKAPFRFGLNGCHDTTLAAMLASLGAFGSDAWPPFTSHVAVELFRAVDHKTSRKWWQTAVDSGRKPLDDMSGGERRALGGHYVRIRYNDEPVVIPGCKPVGKHLDGDDSFCTLEAFKSIVDKFTPRDWKQQCLTNIKSPAFPKQPEPAGY